ncbi:uncharacterized protein [Watersipora subatra]|uniref:uncharacterized protein n=1 Tax=Watersipora subatra TaxID=2589382 RepID=UPI00355B15C6
MAVSSTDGSVQSTERICDIMLTYCDSDKEFGIKLAESLKEKLDVWYADGETWGEPAPRAIVDSKVFIVIMSARCAKEQTIRDHVALAYITNSIIIPVGREYYPDVSKHMDCAMLLTLAKINWIFFVKDDEYEQKFERFLEEVTQALGEYDDTQCHSAVDEQEFFTDLDKYQYNFNRQCSVKRSESKDFNRFSTPFRPSILDFWERHWGAHVDVNWHTFARTFYVDYNETLEASFGKDGADMLMKLMKTDIFDQKSQISRSTYDAFCGKQESESDGVADHFFRCLCDYTVGYFAIREVFNMESSVRLQAIQNIGRFQTPSVICSLCDLTADVDPNIRAVAAIGLGKAGQATKRVQDSLMSLLNDKDWLVRQSACLAEALMQDTKAVQKISDIWRNDPISQVRESAEIAITHIGGAEAEKSLKINTVLSGEIRNLRPTDK